MHLKPSQKKSWSYNMSEMFDNLVGNLRKQHDSLGRIAKPMPEQAPEQAVEQAPEQAVEQAGQAVEQAPEQAVEQAGQAIEQAPEQAVEQADLGQAVEQAPGQAVEQAPGQAVEQAPGQAVEQAPGQAVGQAVEQAPGQAVEQAPGQAVEQAPGQAVGQAVGQAPGQAVGQADSQEDIISINNLGYLTENQKTILLYLSTSSEFTSNKFISDETGIPYASVRNSIRALEREGVILKPSPCRFRGNHGFKFKFSKNIRLFDRLFEQAPGQAPENDFALIKKERKTYLKNLSISDFWLDQGLTQQKLNNWIKEFNFTEDEWETQLHFGAHTPKVINAKNPVNYFYISLKQGGLTRPDGFEFPEERQARIAEENIKARQKALEKLNKIQQENEALAEQEAFNNFLEDKDAVEQALKEIENGYLTPKGRNTIKVYREKGLMDKTLRTKLLTNFKSQE